MLHFEILISNQIITPALLISIGNSASTLSCRLVSKCSANEAFVYLILAFLLQY
jgi:hypothetical protein